MKTEWSLDNEGAGNHRTCENQKSKKELEKNGNDEMKWNDSSRMEMDKSKCE